MISICQGWHSLVHHLELIGMWIECQTRYERLKYTDPDERQVRDVLERLNCCMSLTHIDLHHEKYLLLLTSEDRYGDGRVYFRYRDQSPYSAIEGTLLDTSIPNNDEWDEWKIEFGA